MEYGHNESQWHCPWNLLDLPQRLDRDGQAIDAHPDQRLLRLLPQNNCMAAGYIQSYRCCAWYMLDLSQRFDRDGQAIDAHPDHGIL
jgi:hypothetical protein